MIFWVCHWHHHCHSRYSLSQPYTHNCTHFTSTIIVWHDDSQTLFCFGKVFISELLKINQYILRNQSCNFLLWFDDVIWWESFRDKCIKKFTAIGLYDFWSGPTDRRTSRNRVWERDWRVEFLLKIKHKPTASLETLKTNLNVVHIRWLRDGH